MISDVDFLRIYDIKKLDERFSVSDFDCGDEDLNGFIRNEALFYREELLAMPYVLTEKDRIDRIWAYFTLANDKISVTDFPSNSQFNKFKKENFKKEKFLRSYPSVKVGRLAISKDLQGQGIGTHLLRFIKMYFATDNKTGCRFITLDAYRGATGFYRRNGFDFLQAEDENATQLMYFDLKKVYA